MKSKSWTTTGLFCSWILVAAVTGCKQNPFPDQGMITALTPEPPRTVAPPYGLKVPARAVFEEGKSSSVSIQAWVPAPGSAQVQISGLPPGAVFDAATLQVTWTPGFTDGNDPADPTSTSREYPIKILMFNSAYPTNSLSSETTLVVKDMPRPILVQGTAISRMRENVLFTQDIDIQSADFPLGPFQLNAVGLPAGAVINRQPGSQTAFTLSYTADASVVRFAPGSALSTREFRVDLTAVAPNQAKVVKQLKWTVVDVRNYARISTPGEVTQGPEVNFTFTAEDLNGESAPSVVLNAPVPFGRVVLTTLLEDSPLPADRNPLTVMNIQWTDIPAGRMGTRQSLSFQVCVNKTLNQRTHCRVETVAVNLQPVLRLGVAFDRSAWPMGDTKIVQEGVRAEFTLPVSDLDVLTSVPSVIVQPAELALSGEVVWNAIAKKVLITPRGAGTKQFNLVATSFYGVKQFESFIYDSLPVTRSRVLILGESAQNPEVQAALRILPGAQVVNPSLQSLGARDLAFRDAVVVGTSALKDPAAFPGVELATSRIRNVILQTPLMDRLPEGLKAEVSAMGVVGRGRLLDLANPAAPALSLLHLFIDAGLGLIPPAGTLSLSGNLTSESSSPWIWETPVSQVCRTLASLQSDGADAQTLPFLVTCSRGGASGGRMILSGVELGDIAPTAPEDVGVVQKWASEWVKP